MGSLAKTYKPYRICRLRLSLASLRLWMGRKTLFSSLQSKPMKPILILLSTFLLYGCVKDTPQTAPLPAAGVYYPPAGALWERTSPAALGWDEAALPALFNMLEQKGTKAFLVVHNGRIVLEKYFGRFTADSSWYWASAGKTLTAALVGIAQHEGRLQITDPTSRYLGQGWTSLPPAKENLITVRHQLAMTTGLDDGTADDDCTTPGCLQYKADAGSRWAYHNAPYTLLEKVVEQATGSSYNAYFRQKIGSRIGMDGLWVRVGFNNVFFSTARSMARFGLLLQSGGVWNGTAVLPDSVFNRAQVNSSQSFNPSYGYLTWLNGKASHMLPTLQLSFAGALIPNGPADMYAALGKNDQKLYVVPSRKLVVVRMGETAGNVVLAASSFDNELWGALKAVIR